MHKYQKNKYDIPPVGQLTKENIEMCILHPMKLERILVPTRGGTSSQTIRFACEIAKAYDSILSVLHVVHIPFFMPLNTSLLQREAFSEDVLTRAADIGREYGVNMELKIVRSRSIYRTIYSELINGKYDALVIGSSIDTLIGVGKLAKKIIKEATCPVFVSRANGKEKPNLSNYLFLPDEKSSFFS